MKQTTNNQTKTHKNSIETENEKELFKTLYTSNFSEEKKSKITHFYIFSQSNKHFLTSKQLKQMEEEKAPNRIKKKFNPTKRHQRNFKQP